MQMSCGWWPETVDLFSCTRAMPCGGRCHMVVERLPTGRWDWLAWPGNLSGQALRGEADAPDAAMQAAEDAARAIESRIRTAPHRLIQPVAGRRSGLAMLPPFDYVWRVDEDGLGSMPPLFGIPHLRNDHPGHLPAPMKTSNKVSA